MPPSRAESPTRRKTFIFIAVAVLANSFGNLLLSIGMDRMPRFSFGALPHYFLSGITDPQLLAGTFLTATYSFAQLSLFSWADLSFVVPCIASSYVITALLSEFILNEPVHLERWAGVLLISLGVFLVSRTPPATSPADTLGKRAPE